MKKCIIFPRVSTEAQSYEEQKKELIAMAVADGYTPKQQVIIENKESAIKLDEEHREGIVDMKYNIEHDSNIDCVYIWEVSRWARKKYILFNLQHYLLERKIQLKVKNPNIILLDENGELNANADWMFTIYAQLAETEMTIKLERFKRAKRERKREGYKIGGRISFGYYADDTKKICIDNKEASIVRRIFSLYGTHSIAQIREEIKEYGYDLSHKRINLILKNRAYINDLKDKQGLPITYPRILSDEEFNRVQDLLREFTKMGKEKHYFLCARLIVCPNCGKHFKAVGGNYRCSTRMGEHLNDRTCDCDLSISIRQIDSVAFYLAQRMMAIEMTHATKNQKKELTQEVKDIKKKIEVAEKKIRGIEQKKEKLAKSYIDELINEATYQRMLGRIKEESVALEKQLAYLNEKFIESKRTLENFPTNPISKSNAKRRHEEMRNQEYTEEDMYRITHRYIKEIKVRRMADAPYAKAFEFQFNNVLEKARYLFRGIGKGFRVLTTLDEAVIAKPFNELTADDFTIEVKAV